MQQAIRDTIVLMFNPNKEETLLELRSDNAPDHPISLPVRDFDTIVAALAHASMTSVYDLAQKALALEVRLETWADNTGIDPDTIDGTCTEVSA